MSECKSDIEVIGDVCEVSTEQYCTTFRTRDIGISAGNQIALLHSMLIDRDQRLAAAEAALARIALSETGDKCWSDFAQDFLGWKSTSELWDIIKAAKAGGADAQ